MSVEFSAWVPIITENCEDEYGSRVVVHLWVRLSSLLWRRIKVSKRLSG